jgi:hypothetical protein
MSSSKANLALNIRLTYPTIPEMYHCALSIKTTNQILRCGDAREIQWIPDESIHLVITSPPYWTLKEYPNHKGQLGSISVYEQFHNELFPVRSCATT